ncbi:MAG: 16S rRNA (cytosine(967)-C(5))-methyltransferase RsmB [Xanthomonadales bacterium]|nr:16S rRNA (cytosine(967)-C(5))-methyltransferase RsmB [Gammaproteobacteria bacterium]MBT8052870.1 16S rRNA (cytosine(967)-C(5))-methyltransferase RsmB [Gammaproteobacteria bacterium]NND55669.1 16S rRNA (cytosine(967)-C(5))-methyltransferase RsmB [Xanthomonadales bacterium]NNK49980.1 16S rRNA (cytosine(967)-C(5))-methyltransferase RsmB [Xanthomonadales bacterium]
MNKKPVANARLTALKMLAGVLDCRQNLAESEQENTLADARDRAFARHLAFGVLRWLNALEWLAGGLLKKPLRKKDRDIERLILIGLFQLWKSDSAAHAAVNENAESARKVGKPWAVPVINAVLRRFQRERTEWIARLDSKDERYAHPFWLLDAFKADWPEDWQSIAAANNEPGALWLRLNQQFDQEETSKGLAAAGFHVQPHAVIPGAVNVSPAAGVGDLPGFASGRLSVQDPAAQLAAGLLELAPGQRVLDACAAPGGKTGHILESEPGVALTAVELNQARMERVKENLSRLGLAGTAQLQLITGDSSAPDTWWDGNPFDRILLDAPCSATGVIRRHPEIKWLRNPSQVADAAARQVRLLTSLWPLLTPGGILLYATCSVLQVENSRQIQRFLANHPDAESLEFPATWGRKQDPGQQILPGEQDLDGFYYARLRKNP